MYILEDALVGGNSYKFIFDNFYYMCYYFVNISTFSFFSFFNMEDFYMVNCKSGRKSLSFWNSNLIVFAYGYERGFSREQLMDYAGISLSTYYRYKKFYLSYMRDNFSEGSFMTK